MNDTATGSRLLSVKAVFLWLLTAVFVLCVSHSTGLLAWAGSDTSAAVLVRDDASLLTDEEEQELLSECTSLNRTSGWDVMALTISDAEGEETEEYADQFFLKNCTQDNGVIGMIDMDNRQLYVYTSGEAIDYLTDARIEAILDDAYEYVSDGDYYQALRVMISDISTYYGRGIPAGAYRRDEETGEITYYEAPRSVTRNELLICLAVGLIAGGVFYGSTAGVYQMKLGKYRYDFRKSSHVGLRHRDDHFVRRFVTRRHIPKNPPSGGGHGGGGGSTVHTGSSGHSHGGGGRSF